MSTKTAITLFSGGGGVDLALSRLGYKVVEAVEYCPEIASTFKLNFPEVDLKIQDVATWSSDRQQVNLLHLSPPCVNFSAAKIKKDKCDPNDYLWLETVQHQIVKLKPETITFENVPAYAKSPIYRGFRDYLSQLGYQIFEAIVNFKDYGVPQSRKRLLMRAGLGYKPQLNLALVGSYPKLTWFDAVADLIEQADKTELTARQREALEANYLAIALIPRVGYFNQRPPIVPQWKPAPTLKAHLAEDGKGGSRRQIYTIWYGASAYNVSIPMLKRFATFPEDYKFAEGSTRHACRIMGNAVPPTSYYNWFLCTNPGQQLYL